MYSVKNIYQDFYKKTEWGRKKQMKKKKKKEIERKRKKKHNV